uniref:Transmembrane protein n=1 Tax=Steinernema glaseri TaxID=37863 RepID=A0A1I7ZMU4_9BILA
MGSSQSINAKYDCDTTTKANLEAEYNKKMEETIVLRTMQMENKEALKLAQRREQMAWEAFGVSTTTIALMFAARILQNKLLIVPMVPLIMGMGYRYDQCYGEHATNIRAKASEILKNDLNILKLPGKEITLAELDSRRNVQMREINLP